MTKRDDWPLGPALKSAREKAEMSVRKAAKETRGLISSGRWYQLESGVQKVKGAEIPIGTTPETVVAAALVVGWDVDEALRVAGMSAPEAMVRAIEKKIFQEEDDLATVEDFEPDWVLYLSALLDYVEGKQTDISTSRAVQLLFECEYLASRAATARPDLKAGIDATIKYGDRLNTQLERLSRLQKSTEHGAPVASAAPSAATTDTPQEPRAQGQEGEGEKTEPRNVKPYPRRRKDQPEPPQEPADELPEAARGPGGKSKGQQLRERLPSGEESQDSGSEDPS